MEKNDSSLYVCASEWRRLMHARRHLAPRPKREQVSSRMFGDGGSRSDDRGSECSPDRPRSSAAVVSGDRGRLPLKHRQRASRNDAQQIPHGLALPTAVSRHLAERLELYSTPQPSDDTRAISHVEVPVCINTWFTRHAERLVLYQEERDRCQTAQGRVNINR